MAVPTPVTLHKTWRYCAHSLTHSSPNPRAHRLQLGKLRPRGGSDLPASHCAGEALGSDCQRGNPTLVSEGWQRPLPAGIAPLQPRGGSSAPAMAGGLAVGRSHLALRGPGGQQAGAPDGVAGPGAEGEVHRLLQPTHRFSKITIGCIYTFLKNRKSGNTPSFWAGQLPALPHPCSRPHMLIHVTLGLQEPCAFETTGGSPARRPGWQGPPTSALLTVSIRPSWPKVPGPLLQGHTHARTRTHTSARGALPVPLWSVRGTRARPEPLRPPQSGLAGGAAEHGMEPQADPQPGRGRGTGVP